MSHTFLVPPTIITGEGVVNEMGSHIKGNGTKALIVTDNFMVKFGNAAKVEKALESAGLEYVTAPVANSEPTDIIVNEALAIYEKEGCDCLVALGGGSPMDTAKAVAFMCSDRCKGKNINEFMHTTIDWKIPYLVAIPTTAGTGSEATKNTIISDTVNNVKMLLGGPSLIPALAVIDPGFTMTAPPKITAATGIDAYCHCVEAYTSRKRQLMSDIFAKSAVVNIRKHLPICYKDGSNSHSRLRMSTAALQAGIAFNNSSVTIVHGMSRPIGALFHIAHGVSNAMLLPACLQFAIQDEEALPRFAKLGRLIGVAHRADPDELAAQNFVDDAKRFCKEVGIPTLAEMGVDKDQFFSLMDKMADDALESGSPQNTIHVPTKEQIIEIYKQLWD